MLSKRWIVNYVLLVLIAALTYAGLRVNEESVSEASEGISKLTAEDIDTPRSNLYKKLEQYRIQVNKS